MSIINTFNGEKWRIITPIMLTTLTVVATLGLFILQGIRGDLVTLSNKVELHILDPNLHCSTNKDIEWIKAKLSQIERIAEASNGKRATR